MRFLYAGIKLCYVHEGKEESNVKKKFEKPVVVQLSIAELGEAYYGAMASSCCSRGQRCG